MSLHHCSSKSSTSSNLRTICSPALLTNMSTGPSADSVAWMTCFAAFGSERSAGIAAAGTPYFCLISSTRASSRSLRRATQVMLAPAEAKASAAVLPIPELAPVRQIFLPFNFPVNLDSSTNGYTSYCLGKSVCDGRLSIVADDIVCADVGRRIVLICTARIRE